MKYIPPIEELIKYKCPRKKKKKLVKTLGRKRYYEIIKGDPFRENGFVALLMPDVYKLEMSHRHSLLRKRKLNRIFNEK
jgi:hypothetical protein